MPSITDPISDRIALGSASRRRAQPEGDDEADHGSEQPDAHHMGGQPVDIAPALKKTPRCPGRRWLR